MAATLLKIYWKAHSVVGQWQYIDTNIRKPNILRGLKIQGGGGGCGATSAFYGRVLQITGRPVAAAADNLEKQP